VEDGGINNNEEDYNVLKAICSALKVAEASKFHIVLIIDGLDEVS